MLDWFSENKMNSKFQFGKYCYLVLLNFFYSKEQIELRLSEDINYFGVAERAIES
jgi:hypothetical protein